MSPEIPNSADAIFGAALDLPPEERGAHLIDACRDNLELLAEVRVLLAAHDAAPTGFLDSPAVGSGAVIDTNPTLAADGSGKTSGREADPVAISGSGTDASTHSPNLTEKAGDIMGSYKLLQQIGEGGFGTVWMAEQSEPISRKVALKVIKAGMDTREVLARFEAERQAVALMDHTHIAKVLDAGATKAGRPWFAMELVKGVPITQFCDEQKLATRQRLELFGDVCSAINHAHQKGVIHRDIKPNNVMVALHGDKPVVKVIDFGIAKATQSKLTDKTLFTRFEQLIGTPVYMSPEQASLSGLDIDTRSDIYALGVLLYELLTGKPPFDGKSLISAGYEEMRRIIREEEPPRPSLRLSTVSGEEETTSITSTHGKEPQKLSRIVKGELDWIVMKAIEKDRSRRYETANAFAADIGRYLNDEPVQAAAPSSAYRFRKFARRNKAAIGTAALITFVLIAATGVSTWQAIEAHRARVQSDKDREDSEAISSYLVDAFQSPDPARDGRTITVAETLDTAAEKLEIDLKDQPERRAQLQWTLGMTYRGLGLYDQAVALLEMAHEHYLTTLGREHPDTLAVMNALAFSYAGVEGHTNETLEMQEGVLELFLKVLGPDHTDTLVAMGNLALSYSKVGRHEEALAIHENLLPLMRKINDPERVPDRLFELITMTNLGNSYRTAGRLDESLEIREEVLKISQELNGPKHLLTLQAMANLSQSYEIAGRQNKALEMRKACVELMRKHLGPEHPLTLITMTSLGNSYRTVGRLDKALEIHKEVFKVSRKVNGPSHLVSLVAMINLASSHQVAGGLNEGLKIQEEALEISLLVDDPQYIPLKYGLSINLMNSYRAAGRQKEAFEVHEKAIELSRRFNGEEDLETLKLMRALGAAYHEAGRYNEAIRIRKETIELSRKVVGIDHRDTLGEMTNLALSFWNSRRLDDAIDLQEKTLTKKRQSLSPDDPYLANAIANLSSMYEESDRIPEAIELAKEFLHLFRKAKGANHPDTLKAFDNLSAFYVKENRIEELGSAFAEQSIYLSEAGHGPDSELQFRYQEQINRYAGQLTKGQIDNDTIEGYYRENVESFRSAVVHLYMISIKRGADGAERTRQRQKVESLMASITGGTSFSEVARESSEDLRAKDGGDYGEVESGTFSVDLEAAISNTKPGTVEIHEDRKFFRLIKVEDRRKGEIAPLLEVRQEIAELIGFQRTEKLIQKWKEEALRRRNAELSTKTEATEIDSKKE